MIFGLIWCALDVSESLAPFFWREHMDGGLGVLLCFPRFSAEIVLFVAKKKVSK